MPETQIINPVAPTVRVSSLDNTKMLTHPAAVPPRRGTQKPRREIAGAMSSSSPNVVMKQMPIEIAPGRVDRQTAPEREAATRRSAAVERGDVVAGAEAITETVTSAAPTSASPALAGMPDGAPALLLFLLEAAMADVATDEPTNQLVDQTTAWVRANLMAVGQDATEIATEIASDPA